MDINKNQQVNTFLKGMNTDTSDSMLENSQYRYAENIRLSTDKDSNSGEVRLVDGTTIKATFTDRIIYLNSIREYVIVITKDDTNDTWSIHVSNDKGEHFTTIFGPCTEKIWNNNQEPALCGVIRWESDNNIKLYITDNTGKHGIIPIQIAFDKWPTGTAPTEFKALSGYQQTPLQAPSIQISSTLTGTLNPAKVQYAYRLFKTGGAATTLSPLSKTISFRKDEGGYSYTEKTNKAIEISIDVSNNPHLDQIQLFRINYVQNGQEPTIHKICEKPMNIQDGSFTYLDYGTSIEQLGVSEFLSYVSMEIFPKIIESKGDTLFASNIRYTQDSIDEKFKNYDTRSFSSGNYWLLHNPAQGLNAEQNIQFEFPTGTDFETGGRLIDRSDEADLCHRQFTNNSAGTYDKSWWHPFIQNIYQNGVDTSKIGGKGTNIDWELMSGEIAFDRTTHQVNENWAHTIYDAEKGPVTYKHDEVYRFGIILYDDKGRASSVKWICDVHIPPLNHDDIRIYLDNIVMKSYYIRFTIKHVPDGCSGYQIVQCPRTISDRHVITQGIVGRPYRPIYVKNKKWEYSNYLCPTGLMTMQDMVADNIISEQRSKNYMPWVAEKGTDGLVYKNTESSDSIRVYKTDNTELEVWNEEGPNMELMASSVQDVVQFASPEYAYQPDDIKDILNAYKSQITIEHVTAYDTSAQGTYIDSITNNINIFTMHLASATTFDQQKEQFVCSDQSTNSSMAYRYKIGILLSSPSVSNNPSTNLNTCFTFLQSDFNTVGGVVGGGGDSTTAFGVNRIFDGSRLIKNPGMERQPEFLSFNYIQPKGYSSQDMYNVTYPGIQAISYPNVPEWNSFANGNNIRFADDVTGIGTYSFINWSAPLILTADMSDQGYLGKTFNGTYMGVYNTSWEDWQMFSQGQGRYFQPLGTGGKCILIKLANKLQFGSDYLTTNYRNYCFNLIKNGDTLTFAPINIAKITKPVTPYGGYTKYAIENSTYISNGCYGTFDNFTLSITVDVNNGDGFLGIFKYNASHIWKDGTFVQGATKMATVYAVPLECDIDLTATYGHQFDPTASKSYYIQDKPASFDGYSQEKESYMYNTAYGQIPNVMTYSTASYNEISNFNWDTRIHNSDLKTNGETIDNWLTFKAMNYLDVDSRYGQITDMKLFKDRLMFWQDKAFGVVSSNERTALTDTDNNQIILGNGGILQRFDYLSTIYGMKPDQFVTTQSNHNLYFWDGHEKEILAYGETLAPLATMKGVRNYMNENDEVAHPCMFYDNKNKEIVSSVVNKGSIVYSEMLQAFTSVYTYTPLYHTDVFNDMLSATDHHLHLHNVEQDNVTLFESVAKPLLQYVVNSDPTMPKVFDIQTFGGRFYGGDDISALLFKYNTPLKQQSSCTGNAVTNREYDFRLDIPRNNNDTYGGRMRGKTMQCELKSTTNSSDFSLQYIITKYRVSWS